MDEIFTHVKASSRDVSRFVSLDKDQQHLINITKHVRQNASVNPGKIDLLNLDKQIIQDQKKDGQQSE